MKKRLGESKKTKRALAVHDECLVGSKKLFPLEEFFAAVLVFP